MRIPDQIKIDTRGAIFGLLASLIVSGIIGCNSNEHVYYPPAPQPLPPVVEELPAPAVEPTPVPTTVPVYVPPPADPTPPSAKGVKRAVLWGINKYMSPSAPPLQGCVPDAKNIAAWAITKRGFLPIDIKSLFDSEATKPAVTAACEKVVEESFAGDEILVWGSSHGTSDTIADDNGAEVHQMVCLYDFDWDRAHEMCDVDFVKIFSKVRKGVIFNWGSDSCYSGDLDRVVKKHIQPKSVIVPEEVETRVKKARINGVRTRELVEGLINVGFISGCRKDETSADTQDDQGRPCGAMTEAFLKVIDQNEDKSISEVVKIMNANLSARGYDQHPTASGPRKNKPWLK